MSFDEEQITFFAQTDSRGASVPFGIKAKDRTRHVYVIGKTGMGKSTLLENMAVQDIKNGNGLAFIDPHGQTAEKLLEYIPESRINDVLYFAPFDTENPVSFNVMEDVGADRRHLVVSGLMSVFKKIWVDAWSARMEYILSNTLLALLEYPDSTLLGVNRMLSDKTYRKKVIDNITDPSVKAFWVDEFLKYNERYMQEAGDAIKNKIGQFTSNPLIRNIVGQPKSSFDIREMMDKKKILIMNLSKGLVGETNANLLGSMLTTRIYLAAMSRADMGQEEMRSAPNFYFYVDEFQSFANATFANILSEARKYKLNLTIAHQYIEQMEEEVRNAVFGNVGTTIVFRVGPFDAEVLETVFSPKFLAPDIVNLGFAQIYLTLMIDGIGSQPFSATTLGPIKPAHVSYKDVVIARSRAQFAHPRSEVEASIYQWHGLVDPALPKKPKDLVVSAPAIPTDKEMSSTHITPLPSATEIPINVVQQKEVPAIPTPVVESEPVFAQPAKEGGEKSVSPSNVSRDSFKKEIQKESKRNSERSKKNGGGNGTKSGATHVKNGAPQNAVSNSAKSLEELRAVLRKLTATEQQEKGVHTEAPSGGSLSDTLKLVTQAAAHTSEITQEPVSPSEIKETSSHQKEESTVQDASVLATSEHSSSEEPLIVPVADMVVVPKEVAFPKLVDTVAETQNVKSESIPKVPSPEGEDPLSPKKLERMMRVTGNDRSPFG